MRLLSRVIRQCFAAPLAVFLAAAVMPGTAQARQDSPFTWSDTDFALYPPYCRAKLGEAKDLEVIWKQKLGPANFLHIHHFCFGLKALNMGYASYKDVPKRRSLAKDAVGNFNYILNHTQKDFFMRADALVGVGRAYMLVQQYDEAQDMFEDAIKFNPATVDAWIALSDLQYQTGKKEEALATLEKALESAGEHKKITLRIEDLKKSGVKSSR